MPERGPRRKIQVQAREQLSQIRQSEAEYSRTSYNEQLAVFDRVRTSDFYLYTAIDASEEYIRDEAPYINEDIVYDFYSRIMGAANRLINNQDFLLEAGRELQAVYSSLDTAALLQASDPLMYVSHSLVHNFSLFNSAKAGPSPAFSQLPSVEKFKLNRLCDEIGSEKPESFRETARRYIPRWMSHPISLDGKDIADEDRDVVTGVWSSKLAADRSLLISPEQKAEGVAPLHIAFAAARELEDGGKEDIGYSLRTAAILEILNVEKEGFQKDNPEIPFFYYSLPGLLVGRTAPVKNAYFDYQAAMDETMGATLTRFQKELSDEKAGPATEFLSALGAYYPNHFSEIFAISLMKQDKEYNGFNSLPVIEALGSKGFSWTKDLHEHLYALPERRVLIAHEVAQLKPESSSGKGDEVIAPEQFSDDIKFLAEKGDSYAFKIPLHKLDLKVEGMRSEMIVEIEFVGEFVSAKIQSENGDMKRSVEFRMDFSGESSSFGTDLLGSEDVDPDVAEDYADALKRAVRQEADKIRKQEKQKKSGGKAKVAKSGPKGALPSRQTKNEKREAYARWRAERENEPQIPLLKRSGQDQVAVFTASEVKERRTEREIVDLTRDKVAEMLKEARIEAVSADASISKLRHIVEMANTSGKTFGKRVSRSSVMDEDINLRQIEWVLEGGNIQIRFYVLGKGEGKYELKGILRKTGDRQQENYIAKLIDRIKEENA